MRNWEQQSDQSAAVSLEMQEESVTPGKNISHIQV